MVGISSLTGYNDDDNDFKSKDNCGSVSLDNAFCLAASNFSQTQYFNHIPIDTHIHCRIIHSHKHTSIYKHNKSVLSKSENGNKLAVFRQLDQTMRFHFVSFEFKPFVRCTSVLDNLEYPSQLFAVAFNCSG